MMHGLSNFKFKNCENRILLFSRALTMTIQCSGIWHCND